MADLEPQFSPPSDDPLRKATPSVDDVEAKRARAAIEGRLFSGKATRFKVGRYRIEGRIGSGGMGVVYRAHDPELARDVAVKVLNTDAVSDDHAKLARARLVREARAMARLAHPNVIHVYDVGTVEDGVFIAMELVEGKSLDLWLTSEPRAWTDILAQFIDAGRGLAAAHDAGIVHRDFKPENVLVGADGRVRVGDFGLAGGPASESTAPDGDPRVSSEGELDREDLGVTLTRTGALLGTPKYMAPEQETGSGAHAGSDQFSFCVALYEALFGGPPFAGTTVAVYRSNVRAGDLLPRPLDRRMPPWIYDELVRGLSVAPQERHDGMTALLDRLQEAIVVPVRRVSWARARWLGPGLGFLAAVGVAVGIAWSRAPSEPSRTDAPTEQVAQRTSAPAGGAETAPAAAADPDAPDHPDAGREAGPPGIGEQVGATTTGTSAPVSAGGAAAADDPEAPTSSDAAHDPAADDSPEPNRPHKTTTRPPRVRKNAQVCYFVEDILTFIKATKERRSTVKRGKACYVCDREARNTSNIHVPEAVTCRELRLCTEKPLDACNG